MGVIIGMDPHKCSARIEVVDERGMELSRGRFGTEEAGYAGMLAAGRRFTGRVWAVEGCNGIGRHIAHRLVHDGEMVLDVPGKLSAQVRVFGTGNGRKTDPVDAHSVAMVALRTPGLVGVRVDADLVVMGMLVDRRDELGRAHQHSSVQAEGVHQSIDVLGEVGERIPVGRFVCVAVAALIHRDCADRGG